MRSKTVYAGMQKVCLAHILQFSCPTGPRARVRPTVHRLHLYHTYVLYWNAKSAPGAYFAILLSDRNLVPVSDRPCIDCVCAVATVTHEGRYPCLEDMHVTDRHRRRCDINDFRSNLCNSTTYSIKLEILTLQTRKFR